MEFTPEIAPSAISGSVNVKRIQVVALSRYTESVHDLKVMGPRYDGYGEDEPCHLLRTCL